MQAFSRKRVGILSSCGASASHCSGFSCCRAWALGVRTSAVAACGLKIAAACGLQSTGSVVVAHRLTCPAACGILVPPPGMEPASSALQGGFLHWTSREIPRLDFCNSGICKERFPRGLQESPSSPLPACPPAE